MFDSPETISTLVLLAIAAVTVIVATILRKTGKVSSTDYDRLIAVASQAITAAEEIGARERWTSAQKLAFARDTIKRAFPDADMAIVDMVIHAALAASPFSSAVNKAKDEDR